MKEKNEKPAGKTIAKETKNPLMRKSLQPPPTAEELKKAVAAKKALALKVNKPLAGDIARIKALQLKEEAIKCKPIVFSDDWYEFSVFCQKLSTGASTVNKWLQNGWLAYSAIGRLRFINRADFDEMMRRFRKPAFFWLTINSGNESLPENGTPS